MKTAKIRMYDSRRCDVARLDELVRAVPIEVSGHGLRLSARMGLGRIIYLTPERGEVSTVKVLMNSGVGDVKIDIVERAGKDFLLFDHQGQRYELQYRSSGVYNGRGFFYPTSPVSGVLKPPSAK